MKKLLAVTLLIALLCQVLPMNALASVGKILSQDEINRARAITGLSFDQDPNGEREYRPGTQPNAGWTAKQLRGWLSEKLDQDLGSICDTLSQAFYTMADLKKSDPDKHKRFIEDDQYQNALSMQLEAEKLREELRYYNDQLKEASGVIAEMSRWMAESRSSIFDSDAVRYSVRISDSQREITQIRDTVLEKSAAWQSSIAKWKRHLKYGPSAQDQMMGIGDWMNALMTDDTPVVETAAITRMTPSSSLRNRLQMASGLLGDADAQVTVYSDNEVAISLMTEQDGKQVPVDGASVQTLDILDPDGEWVTRPYENGVILIPINTLTADEFDLFHLAVKIDPTAQGFREVAYEDLDLERGVLYTCMLTPLASEANDSQTNVAYIYKMSFNTKDIMQSEYEMIYSPANDYDFDIHVGIKNPSELPMPQVKMGYYANDGARPVKYCEVEPTSVDGDTYTFTGPWKQLFSPYATKDQRPVFILSDPNGIRYYPSQLVSLKSATDAPINEGTGAEGGVFANVLGTGFSGAFKIPFIDVNVKLNLPWLDYWPKACINPGGYAVLYVGTDVFQDEITSLSLTHWQSKDMKEYRNRQKSAEKKEWYANYKSKYNEAKEFYKEKRYKCLGDYSIDFGWYALATARWELENVDEDILSKIVTFQAGTGITISLSASWTFYPIAAVPLFYISVSFGVSAGFGIEFSLDLSYVNGFFQDWSFRPYDSFTVDIGLLFALQVGFGVKGFVEIFGRGAITLDLVFTISMNSPPTIVITLVGDATAGITIFFVTFTKTWNFLKEQLYPSESVSNLLAFFMHQGDEEPTSREPAYGEPFSYPWLVEKAKEELPPNPGFVNYWAAGDYKVVRAKDKMYIFYIGTANNPDDVSHKRLAWNLMDGDTNLEVHGSLQSVIDSDEAKAATQGDVEWIAAINRRDDYAFDVFGHGDYIYIVTTCAREFDENGCPVANDLTDLSSLKNMLTYVTVLEPNNDGTLSHLLSLTDSSGHNYVFGAASISYKPEMCETYDYESFTGPRISYAGEKWEDQSGNNVFQYFEIYGEMPRVAYPDKDMPTGATGFIYQGWGAFTLDSDKLVQSSMGDGYERTQIQTLDTGSYFNLPGRGSLGFVGLSRPKNGAEGDSAIELFSYNMNYMAKESNRKAVTIETGPIDHLVLVENLEWDDRQDAYSTVFYTKKETNEDGAAQYRLYGLRIEPAEGNASEIHVKVKRFKYDVVTPVSEFNVAYINDVPYLYWLACTQKKDEYEQDIWSIWVMMYDEESNIVTSPSVLTQFRLPELTYWIEAPDEQSQGIWMPLDGIIGNVMLTNTGAGYFTAIAKDIESIPISVRPDTPPASLFSFPEQFQPMANLVGITPKELVVKAGSFDDISMGVTNDGNVGISRLDFTMYEVSEQGVETRVETAHIDAHDPSCNSLTMADGTVVQTGETVGYREEDYDNTSRKRDWVLDHDYTDYRVYMTDSGIATETKVLEPSDPYYIRTDVLMPGSTGSFTASFKIPDDWTGGTKTLRMKLSALSTYINWTHAMALAAGAPSTRGGSDNGTLIQLNYVLNEKTGKLELQKPANATGALAEALKSGRLATEINGASIPLAVQVHDLEVSHRVYKGLGGERWLDILIRNHAATREGMKLVCAVYVDGSKNPTYVNLPYYENATLSHKSQTITLPLNALVDNPSAHRMARVEIMSVDRDERAYSNNEFTVYLGGAPELRYDSEITGEIDRDGKHLVFTSVVQALAGETVTMRAYPVGGVKPYQYQWWMYDPDTGKWAQLKNGGAVSGVDTDTLKLQHVRPEWSGRRAVCVITDSAGNTFPDPADWIRYAITLQITGSDDELPDTGDHSNLPLYLAIALAALALLWWTRRKRA